MWHHEKEILGWNFNSKNYIIQLSAKKCQTIINTLDKIIKLKGASLNHFQKLAGKLQHASFCRPSKWGLFSPIQMAMQGDPKYIYTTNSLKIILKDWWYINKNLMTNTTLVLHLVSSYPSYIGTLTHVD